MRSQLPANGHHMRKTVDRGEGRGCATYGGEIIRRVIPRMTLNSRRIQRKSGFSIEERTPENCRGGTNLKEHHLNGVLDYHKDWLQHQIDDSYEVGVIEDSDGHLMVGATNSVSSPGILGGTSGTSASCAE